MISVADLYTTREVGPMYRQYLMNILVGISAGTLLDGGL